MPTVLTIGIPAHNEEKTIRRLLTGIIKNIENMSEYDIAFEIVVATNSCTDNTELVVEEFAKNNNIPFKKVQIEPLNLSEPSLLPHTERLGITVLSISQKGKAVAWNAIYNYAKGDMVCFFDADVILSEETIKLLYEKLLNSSDLFAVACDIQPIKSHASFTHRYLTLEAKIVRSYRRQKISGGGYIIRKINSFPIKLPYDLIGEDAYLTTFIATNDIYPYNNGINKIYREKDAIIWHSYAKSFREYFKERVRAHLGVMQVDMLCEDKHKTIKELIRDRRPKKDRLIVLNKKERILWTIMKIYPRPIIKFLNKKAWEKAVLIFVERKIDNPTTWTIKRD